VRERCWFAIMVASVSALILSATTTTTTTALAVEPAFELSIGEFPATFHSTAKNVTFETTEGTYYTCSDAQMRGEIGWGENPAAKHLELGITYQGCHGKVNLSKSLKLKVWECPEEFHVRFYGRPGFVNKAASSPVG
jgi:hypothetical protein